MTRNKEGRKQQVWCPWCQRDFRDVAALDQHCVARHRDLPTCGTCGRRFGTQTDLEQHQAVKMHGAQGSAAGPVKAFTCLTCKKSFFPLLPILHHQVAAGHVGIHPTPFPEKREARPFPPGNPLLSQRPPRNVQAGLEGDDGGPLVIRTTEAEGRVIIRNLPPKKPPATPAWALAVDAPGQGEQLHGMPCPHCGRPGVGEDVLMQGDEQVVIRKCRLCGYVERL